MQLRSHMEEKLGIETSFILQGNMKSKKEEKGKRCAV